MTGVQTCALPDLTFKYEYPSVTAVELPLESIENNNAGWRIDYFVISNRLTPNIESATIYNEIFGSDHCPVGLELN